MSDNQNDKELQVINNGPSITIESEMQNSYLEYAMSVIVGRVLFV